MSVSKFPSSYKDSSPVGLQDRPYPGVTSANSMTSAKTLFPVRPHSQAPVGRDFGGTLSVPEYLPLSSGLTAKDHDGIPEAGCEVRAWTPLRAEQDGRGFLCGGEGWPGVQGSGEDDGEAGAQRRSIARFTSVLGDAL